MPADNARLRVGQIVNVSRPVTMPGGFPAHRPDVCKRIAPLRKGSCRRRRLRGRTLPLASSPAPLEIYVAANGSPRVVGDADPYGWVRDGRSGSHPSSPPILAVPARGRAGTPSPTSRLHPITQNKPPGTVTERLLSSIAYVRNALSAGTARRWSSSVAMNQSSVESRSG